MLDTCGIRWEYEPVEFVLSWDRSGGTTSAFRPDFWLPEVGCFVEITTADQRWVTRKNAKVRRLRRLHPEVRLLVLYQRDIVALLDRHGLRSDLIAAA